MKNSLYSLVIIIFCMGGSAFAQTMVKGVIIDEYGEPLFGANILIDETTGAITDYDGNYSFADVANGNYTLSVTYIGFKTQSKEITVAGEESLTVDFTLMGSSEQLQEVEITGRREKSYKNNATFAATKTATLIKDIPQAVSYVTKEVFADQQAFNVSDVVKNISGVNQFSYYDDFSFRGFRSGDTYINGLRVVGLFGPQPLLANIERVEIIKGPASAMFGNSVPGGLMNRVTKKPLSENRTAINFTVGSFNTLRTTADFTGPLNKSKTLLYRLNLAYENSDSFRDLQEKKANVIAPSISFLPTDKTSINFDLVITNFEGKLDRGQPIFGAAAGTDLNSTPINFAIGQSNDFQKTAVAYSTLSLNHQFSDHVSFNASYMKYIYNENLLEHRTSNEFALDGAGDPIPTLMGMRVIERYEQTIADNISSYFVFKADTGPIEHKIVAGFDYNAQQNPIGNAQSRAEGYKLIGGGVSNDPDDIADFQLDDDGIPIPNVPHFDLVDPTYSIAQTSQYTYQVRPEPATKYYSYGFYLQDQMKWNKIQLLLGGRQEYYNDVVDFKQRDETVTTQKKFLPRVGLVYSATDNINVYGTYTESFQPQGPAVQTNPLAGGPFDPIIAYMVETGAKGEFFNKRLAANLAIYYIENNNILKNAQDPSNPDLLRQRGQEQSTGVELDINGRILSNLTLTANYAYNKAIISDSDIEAEIGRRIENAPLHQGGFFGKYTIDRGSLNGIAFTLGTNFVGERNTEEVDLQLPAYTIFDAGVSYNIERFNVRLLVNNIFDKTHWVGGYNYTRLFPGSPRMFLMSVGYTF